MSSSNRRVRFAVRNAAQRNGQYPNTNHPEGYRFNVPAVARGLNFSNDGVTISTLRRSLTSSRDGSANTEPSGNPPTDRPGAENPAAASEGNDSMTNNTSPVAATTSNLYQNVEVAASDGGSVPGRRTNGLSVPRKRSSGLSIPHSSHKPEDNNAESVSTPRLPSRPILPKSASGAKKRKRRAADEPEEAASGSDTRQAAISSIRIARGQKSECSGQLLKYPRFATKEYKASQALRPSGPLFKPDQSRNVATIAEAKTRRQDGHELSDIFRILHDLVPPHQRKYFDTFEGPESSDERCNAEAETRTPGDQEEDDEEQPRQQEAGVNQESGLVPYTGLNTNLKPLSDIHEIFVDLTGNALKQGFGKFLQANGSNQLRVATLCSGTESPLLALQMVSDSEKIGLLH